MIRCVIKTFGWLVVSGLIIFTSNIIGGANWEVALLGAIWAKIGTTITYFFYEILYEKYVPKRVQPDLGKCEINST